MLSIWHVYGIASVLATAFHAIMLGQKIDRVPASETNSCNCIFLGVYAFWVSLQLPRDVHWSCCSMFPQNGAPNHFESTPFQGRINWCSQHGAKKYQTIDLWMVVRFYPYLRFWDWKCRKPFPWLTSYCRRMAKLRRGQTFLAKTGSLQRTFCLFIITLSSEVVLSYSYMMVCALSWEMLYKFNRWDFVNLWSCQCESQAVALSKHALATSCWFGNSANDSNGCPQRSLVTF